MPIKTTPETDHRKKWNMYVNEFEKLEFLKALIESGKPKAQSAAVRAFMHLYVIDTDVRDKVNSIVDNFIVYKDNGDVSSL